MARAVKTTDGAQINGVLPTVGASVFDVVKKQGTIAHVESDYSFTVEFPNGSRQRYSTGGLVNGNRRIYWKDPFIVDPKPDDANWNLFTDIAQTIYEKLGG